LICPLAFPETQGTNSPQLRVLEKDEALLNSLSEADRQQFDSIHVRQNSHVWQRFRDEVLSGLKIADNSFLSNHLNQNKLFSRNVDNIDKPYEQPTLILLGRQDCMVGYRDSWKLIENYSRASFVILDKAGHNLQNEQEELFQELVKEWIDRVSSEIAERA
jgi:pimeloyl-ACP methyl ester carboxylesterase